MSSLTVNMKKLGRTGSKSLAGAHRTGLPKLVSVQIIDEWGEVRANTGEVHRHWVLNLLEEDLRLRGGAKGSRHV